MFDRPERRWSGRSLPAARLDKSVKLPTDLYFIQTECENGYIKIGISSNVMRRMAKMQMDCPYKLIILKRVVNGAAMEKELHERFAGDRVTGEWFRKSDALLAAIEAL